MLEMVYKLLGKFDSQAYVLLRKHIIGQSLVEVVGGYNVI